MSDRAGCVFFLLCVVISALFLAFARGEARRLAEDALRCTNAGGEMVPVGRGDPTCLRRGTRIVL